MEKLQLKVQPLILYNKPTFTTEMALVSHKKLVSSTMVTKAVKDVNHFVLSSDV